MTTIQEEPLKLQLDLADLVSQLEAPKFARLLRFMVNLPVPRDELRLPAAAYGLRDTEIFVRKLGQPASYGAWAATWIFHQAYLPVGLWSEGAIVRHLEDRLTIGQRDFDAHPNAHSILYGSAQQKGDRFYIPDATDAFYYLATNIAASLSEDAMNAVAHHFRKKFGSMFTQFGLATPQSMAQAGPQDVWRFTLDILNSPSSYYFLAREGRVSVSAVTEHGLYYTDADDNRSAATAVSALSFEPPGLADLRALVASSATSEADLQAFFTEHPHFLLGLDDHHCEVTPHVILSSPADTGLVPDFMVRLENVGQAAFIELKKPTASIVNSSEPKSVGKVAAQAIKQLMNYTDAVSSNSFRSKMKLRQGSAPFDPHLVVLIGRGSPSLKHIWRSSRAGIPNVQLVTYDFLIERARTSRKLNDRLISEIKNEA